MSKKKTHDSFWTSYSDLMTSLFFVMLVLFIVCLVKVNGVNQELKEMNAQAETRAREAEQKSEELENILQLKEQFKVLTESSSLAYDPERKMFYAKDFQGIEIFNPFTGNNMQEATEIKSVHIANVEKVGRDINDILKKLNANGQFSYQLIIEGNAAIPWQNLKSGSFDADNQKMYELSYHRALALYNYWKKMKLNFRQYNTEIIIAGSGFNGNNRDNVVEDNNKRFVIQIIPKIDKPEDAK